MLLYDHTVTAISHRHSPLQQRAINVVCSQSDVANGSIWTGYILPRSACLTRFKKRN